MRNSFFKTIFLLLSLILFSCHADNSTTQYIPKGYNFHISKKATFYVDNSQGNGIYIDPYLVLRVNTTLIDQTFPELNIRNTTLREIKNKYDVIVKYKESGDNVFIEFPLNEALRIEEDHPIALASSRDTLLFANKSYDFIFHFINKETKSVNDRINLFISYEFLSSINTFQDSVNIHINQEYHLLNNVSVFNSDNTQMTIEQILEKYHVEYTFIYPDMNTIAETVTVIENKIIITEERLYSVQIIFTDKLAGSSNPSSNIDTSTSVTPIENRNKFAVNYDINVNSN